MPQPSDPPSDIPQRIGNTALLHLRNIVPKNSARILLELENENPAGSMKDRMALAMIETAEADVSLSTPENIRSAAPQPSLRPVGSANTTDYPGS
jgi:cysteine synthase